jgi:hypothetical protein
VQFEYGTSIRPRMTSVMRGNNEADGRVNMNRERKSNQREFKFGRGRRLTRYCVTRDKTVLEERRDTTRSTVREGGKSVSVVNAKPL